ncbi:MAG: alpha-amylase family glycosyl hydrolase [Bacteriovoracaceae bacterium]
MKTLLLGIFAIMSFTNCAANSSTFKQNLFNEKAVSAFWVKPNQIELRFEKSFIGRNFKVSVENDQRSFDLGQKSPRNGVVHLTFGPKIKNFFSSDKQGRSSWFVTVDGIRKKVYFDFHYLNHHFTTKDKKLGVHIENSSALFSLWSPSAEEVHLEVYKGNKKLGVFPLKYDEKGVWKTKLSKKNLNISSFDKLGYGYNVKAFGTWKKALDPYAMSMRAFKPHQVGGRNALGLGVILENFDTQKIHRPIQNLKNAGEYIGYEIHVRDATIADTRVPKNLRGTYKGFSYILDEIKDLGITHIQFLPLQNFYTVDEADKSYQDEGKPKNNINYNWGYDPHNYFTPEGWYSTNASDPYRRIHELQEMVQNVHAKGMGAILDVVYNHLYDEQILLNAAEGCYLRRTNTGEISYHSGAGASLESRNHMVRRLMIDSLKHWKNVYGFDGFRFDLMGFHDQETMVEVRKALGKDVIVYGEAWEFSDLPMNQATTKSQMPKDATLSAFNDSSRDSYAGWMQTPGFVQGKSFDLPKVYAALMGGLKSYPHHGFISQDAYHRFSESPLETLQFLSIHDGFTLWDKINLSYKGKKDLRTQLVKQSMAMLLTSQGKVILHAGSELGRSKPLATNDPNPDRAHTTKQVNMENGIKKFHENTYRSPDKTNQILWGLKEKNKDLYRYVKGLIEFRRNVPGLRYERADSVSRGLKFYPELFGNRDPVPHPDGPYSDFKDPNLSAITIKFIQAPDELKGKRVYLAGEIHSGTDKNPANNSYSVQLDSNGKGEIVLNRNQVLNFDFTAWSDPEALQFKVVQTPGKWDSPKSAYSDLGNNSFRAKDLARSGEVIIDLSIMNYSPGTSHDQGEAVIAYLIDNQLESSANNQSNLKKVFIVHNALQKPKRLKLPDPHMNWEVYGDGEQVGLTPIANSEVFIGKGFVTVPSHSSAILAY